MISPLYDPRLKALIALLLAVSLWLVWTIRPIYAQGPVVTTTDPAKNAANVEATSSLTITFDTTIDSATVNTQTLTIRGEQTGIYAGSYTFPAGNTVSIDPSNQFEPGEVVRVVASSQIESSGSIPATPYQWQFTVTSQDGTGTGDAWQEQTIDGSFGGAWSVTAADVDGDGDMDVLGVAQSDDDIAWWENDGSQSFTKHTIAGSFDNPRLVHAADVDGDGDLDVLGVAQNADDIIWWENNGSQSFTKHTIEGNYDGAQSVTTADVDGDGDLDVLGAAEQSGDITWWENDGSQNFTEHTIKDNFGGARAVYVADVDGDGDLDVLGAASGDNDITWWENDGSQNFTEHTIDGNFNQANSVTAADVDGDGDLDVLGAASGADDITVWYNIAPEIMVVGNGIEISSGDTSPSTTDDTDFGNLTLGDMLTHTFTISSTGADDLILSGSPTITLSNGTAFTVTQPAATTLAPSEITTFTLIFDSQSEGTFTDTVSIINNDADESPYTFVVEGTGGAQVQAVYPVENSLNVTATSAISLTYDADIAANSVSTATVTVRGEQTGIYSGSYNMLASNTILITPTNPFKAGEVVRVVASSQVENTAAITTTPYQWQFTITSQNGPGTGDVWQEQTISGYNGAWAVYAADMDGDGDLDLLGAASVADDITWWENDGNQTFTKHTIQGNFTGARDVYAADMDGDGDLDVLGAALDDNDVTWWENDGNQTFTEHTIDGDFAGAGSVYAADMDRDGDLDVLGAALNANDITWWENDGNQTFTEHTIKGNFGGAWAVYAADMDGDGDLDVLGAALSADDITWWENDGYQSFTEHPLNSDFDGASSVYAVDMDGDGDLDVLGAAFNADQIRWWENDGQHAFTEHTIADSFNGIYSAYAADMDGDGDLDVLGTAYNANDITWWENDGNQNFSQQTIEGNFSGAKDIYAADMDGDGDLDVLGAALTADEISLWYNTLPEIAVVGNGTEISSGDTSPNSADDTDFGSVTVGETVTHTFTISNTGLDDLSLSGSPTMTLTNGSVFTVTQPLSTNLAPGETTTFDISFTPPGSGFFTDTVSIINNDADESPYTFVVGGGGRPQVQAVYPLENSLNVTPTSSISLTYNDNIAGNSVSTATVTVRGEQTGIYSGDYGLLGGNTIFITPTTQFKAGEVLRVVASSRVESTEAIGATPYHWQFTVSSQDGTGTGAVWQKQTIKGDFDGAVSVTAVDMDGDGDLDILGAADNADDIIWWENDGSQNFSEHIIAGDFDGAVSVTAADVDGDGDLDVLSTASAAMDITWWENDGSQNFSEHTIAGDFDGASGVRAVDVDGDGDLDVLGTAYLADAISWWENDGSQNFSEYTIAASFDGAYDVYAADVDGDGDLDVLGAANTADDITWWENDGQQAFTEHTIADSFDGASAVYVADVDGDGDLDVLGTAVEADDIIWWENDGSQNFSEHIIVDSFDGASAVYVADADGDGDLDVFGTAFYADEITVWYNVVPEIAVLGNSLEINSGDINPSITNDTDFGMLGVGDMLTHTFTISSIGADDLILSGSPTITLSNGTAFTVTQPAATTVSPGQSTGFSIIFTPQSLGSFTDTVTIANNDADENPYTFVVSGIGTCFSSPVYVNQNAGGSNNGTSWTNAFIDLQDALALAQSCRPIEIWVAAGIYTPGSARTDTFQLTSDVQLYGGFVATETLRTERNWETNITVLSGDIDGNDTTDADGVVTDTANVNGSNSYHVVQADGSTDPITESTVLDGFTITAGKANFNPGVGPNPDATAGGLYCYSCNADLRNLTFSGNSALYWGGAMVNALGNPSLNTVIFSSNSATGGGAMYNASGSPSLNNVIFSGNSANSGGAMFNIADDGSYSPSLVNVTFSGNAADDGGAIYNYASGGTINPNLSNVILWGNTATGNGSQIYNDGVTPVINYTLIQSDTGAIYNDSGASITYGPNILTGNPLFVDAAGADGILGTPDDDLRLLPGSPAIDSGDNSAAPAEDIKGVVRPVSSIVDMGAYESQGFSLTINSGNNQSTLIDTPFAAPLRITISSAFGEPVGPGGVISFTAPGSGAGVTTPTLTATTTSSGVASVTVTANSTSGSYLVEAAANGIVSPVSFSLTNNVSYTLTVNIIGSGTITPDGGMYSTGTVLSLDATPDLGWQFEGWSGDLSGSDDPASLLIDQDRVVTATFEILTYTLDLTTTGNGFGSIEVDPGSGPYDYGTVITLTAIPDSGWQFEGWSGDLSSTANPSNLTIDGDKAVNATFGASTASKSKVYLPLLLK